MIVGNSAAAAAGINVDAAVAFLTSASSIAYYTAFVKANVPGLLASEVDLAVKAAVVGSIIYNATVFNNGAGVGSYATAANNLVKDLADDGKLVNNNTAGIDLFTAYPVVPGVGSTYALSINADTLTGTGGNDTFTGVVSATANTTTATTGDVLNGGAGTDTLSLTVASTANPGLLQTSSIETVTVRALGDATIDLLLANDIVNLNSTGGTNDLTVNNAQVATTFGVSNTITTGGATADLTVNFRAVDVLGTADVAKLSVESAGSSVLAAGQTVPTVTESVLTVGAGVEAISLATKGSNWVNVVGTATVDKLTVTGDGVNTITVGTMKAAATIDASTSTGTNTFALGTALSTGDVVTGGTGADTVSFTASNTASVTMSGVETLQVNGGTAVTTFSANPNLTSLNVRSTDATTVAGLTTLSNLNYQGTQLAAYAGTSGNVSLNTAFAGASDALAINVGNRGVTANGGYNIGTLKVSGVEGITLTQTDMLATGTTTAVIHDTGLKTLTATTPGNLALTLSTFASNAPGFSGTASTTGSNSVTSIDLSAVVGTGNMTFEAGTFAAAATVKAATGGSNFTFGAETASDVITVTGGNGVDSITTGNAGTFTVTLGGGATNTFDGSALTAAASGNTVNVTGGDGADTITGGANVDTIVGGAGNDIITGGRGADVINGGLGADTYRVAVGSAAVAATGETQTITAAVNGAGNVAGTYVIAVGGGSTVQFTTDATPTAAEFVTGMAAALTAAAAGRYTVSTAGADITLTFANTLGNVANTTVQVFNSATAAGATAALTNGLDITVTNTTQGVNAVAAVDADSTSTAMDQLTFVSNSDIIDVVAGAIVINGGDAGTAAAAGNANISATGLATFHVNDNTLALKLTAIAADLAAGGEAAREAAVFVDQGQAYLFLSDGVAGFSAGDAVIQLVGITTLANGMTLSGGGDITAIS
ncbi:hypothetical protein CA606_10380 [Caulobacter vibrioides]|uniref:Uncharacterized protein n=1 Tax=Caulobacter vibrioides TaxID=155892 RepID=A0A290MKX8_CAUVI|nr:hypothetical protein [Caulobacter vibrioides]ATC32717.1 hypothetical protein CA606_10380 [Caulobacter vibrioides]